MAPLRALLAFAVLFGHFQFYDVPALMPLRHLAPVSVAMFLFISGYGLAYSYQQKGDEYLRSFFSKRILKILIPAILVTLLQIILFGNGGIGIVDRAQLIFSNGNTMMPHYWYVWAILFFYVLFWLCYKFARGWFSRLAVLIGVICFTLVTSLSGFDRCWWICSLAFPTGLYFTELKPRLFSFCEERKLNYWLTILVSGVAFVGFFMTGSPSCWTLCYVFVPLIGALIISRLPLDKFKLPILRFIGMVSYEIYLVHITVMSLFRESFFHITSNTLYVVTVIFVTIILAYGIHLLCQLITTKTN